MKIEYSRPPVWDRAVTELGADEDTLFCYGDTIFAPSGRMPNDSLVEHEKIHELQQSEFGVEEWWDRYFYDEKFRFEQELPAYRRQYQHYCIGHKDRNDRARYLASLSRTISGSLYGHIAVGTDVRKMILGQ